MFRSFRAPMGAAMALACTTAFGQDTAPPAVTLDAISAEPTATGAPASQGQATSEAALPQDAVLTPTAEAQPATAEASSSEATVSGDSQTGFRGAAFAARVSTLGIGLEAVAGLHKRVNLRLQGNAFSYDETLEEDGVSYEGELKLQTFGALLDFHPFAGSFRLTAGGFQNGNQIDLNARCISQCEVGDLTISRASAADDPRIFGRADFQSFAPYLGLGFGNAMRGGPFHFAFDIGVLMQGSTRIDLNASGIARVTDNRTGVSTTRNLATDPEVQRELRNESRSAEEETKEFKYYPVISLTLGYRFNLF